MALKDENENVRSGVATLLRMFVNSNGSLVRSSDKLFTYLFVTTKSLTKITSVAEYAPTLGKSFKLNNSSNIYKSYLQGWKKHTTSNLVTCVSQKSPNHQISNHRVSNKLSDKLYLLVETVRSYCYFRTVENKHIWDKNFLLLFIQQDNMTRCRCCVERDETSVPLRLQPI